MTDPLRTRYQHHLRCPRCGWECDEPAAFEGCRPCNDLGVGANVHPVYDLTPDGSRRLYDDAEPGLFGWRALLPVDPAARVVSLQEGGTPLVDVSALAPHGVGRLLVKDETRNPTWSYKDRLAAVAVSKAVASGADTVVVATTGNHGAAAAAYAAAAGIRCVALTLASVPTTMKTLMQVYGATVVALRSGPDRWRLMAEAVRDRGWVPISGFRDPPAGSNPFGIEGYKTIAYELVRDLGAAPQVVVVPTAYADGLAGIQRGFADLQALGHIRLQPRLVAAEPLGPLAKTLARGQDASARVDARASVAFSTATPVATYQGVHALRASRGLARAVPDDARVLEAQQRLASCGLYLEASAALCLPAVEDLVHDGTLGPADTVVMIGSSTGLKDVDATAAELPPVAVVSADLRALDASIEDPA